MIRDLDALIPDLTALAQDAGRAIMAVYAKDFEHQRKADGSPVTIADAQAEAIILRGLAALTPEIPAIAEESVDEAPTLTSDTFWLVDPLDGTRSFVAREDEFSVNIGLIKAGIPVLGVIHGPVDNVTYTATGPGSVRQIQQDGNGRGISGRQPPADGHDAAVSRFHSHSDKMTELLARCSLRNLVRCSSALKFGILAAGGADFYPRLGPTSEWDTAAGHAILRAIGGDVVTLDGTTLTYNKPGYRNPAFVAYARHHPCPPTATAG